MTELAVVTENTKKLVRKTMSGFQMKAIDVKQKFPLQFAVDFGGTPGPWIIINFNSKAYLAGWLPKRKNAKTL